MELRILKYAFVTIVVALVVLRVIPALIDWDGSLHHSLHWMVYGHDRVWYRDRTYILPKQISAAKADALYGPLIDTKASVIGMQVLDTKGSLNSPDVPTVLLLRKNDTTDIEYVLSGGP